MPAYLLCGSILKYDIQSGHTVHVKNRDSAFGLQVSRPHLETVERFTKHVILIHYSKIRINTPRTIIKATEKLKRNRR